MYIKYLHQQKSWTYRRRTNKVTNYCSTPATGVQVLRSNPPSRRAQVDESFAHPLQKLFRRPTFGSMLSKLIRSAGWLYKGMLIKCYVCTTASSVNRIQFNFVDCCFTISKKPCVAVVLVIIPCFHKLSSGGKRGGEKQTIHILAGNAFPASRSKLWKQ